MEAAFFKSEAATVMPGSRDRLVIGLFLLACALFLFLDRGPSPIVLWDESRNIVNALEMHRNGIGLVTTYGGAPDLWNTKPPLLIWVMSVSVSLFGPSEFSLRLPSAVAALGTLLILVLFLRRVTGSLWTALAGGAMLALSPGFFGEHGARTADYDSLLLFFVTAYVALLFFAVHSVRPSMKMLLLAGALIGCAALTKSSAAFVPGLGVAAYIIATGRFGRVCRNPRYAAMAAVAACLFLAFLLAREAAAPGYWSAALHNDLIGRVQGGLMRRSEGPLFYAQSLLAGLFFAGPLLLLLPLALPRLRGKSRAAFLWSVTLAAGILVPLSLVATKLPQYALTAFPPLAAACAIGLGALSRAYVVRPFRLGERTAPLLLALVGVLFTAHLGAQAADWRYRLFPARQIYPRASYGLLFEALAARGLSRVVVLDGGSVLDADADHAPLLTANALLWRERGLSVVYGGRSAAIVASCDPAIAARLAKAGSELAGISGCAAITRR